MDTRRSRRSLAAVAAAVLLLAGANARADGTALTPPAGSARHHGSATYYQVGYGVGASPYGPGGDGILQGTIRITEHHGFIGPVVLAIGILSSSVGANDSAYVGSRRATGSEVEAYNADVRRKAAETAVADWMVFDLDLSSPHVGGRVSGWDLRTWWPWPVLQGERYSVDVGLNAARVWGPIATSPGDVERIDHARFGLSVVARAQVVRWLDAAVRFDGNLLALKGGARHESPLTFTVTASPFEQFFAGGELVVAHTGRLAFVAGVRL
jgi:hypothetical protein